MAQHGSLPLPSEFAHSLYLEALAELGIVGLLLIGGAVLVAAVGAVRSAIQLQSGEIAAAAACGIAFFAAAAYDWVWQLAGMAIVGVGMLGFALGALPAQRASAWGRFGALRPALALLAVAAIIPQYVVLAAGSHIRNSHAAFNEGTGREHGRKLSRPRRSSPGRPARICSSVSSRRPRVTTPRPRAGGAKRSSIRDATGTCGPMRRSSRPRDGNVAAARRDLAEARRLNPHSTVLAKPKPAADE